MTETDAAADRAALVPGVHRLIRAVDGKEGPFAGTLVAFDDSVAVCVDVEQLREWAGWVFSDAEHVCGVLDVRRRMDGHDALLPWCTQRVETFLGRRDASDSPLAPGELGTLVVSLLRGVRELGADADVLGDWWLTGDGRPLFVHGEGGTARARTAALLERLGRQQADRATVRALEEAATAMRGPRHPVDDDRRWEEQLFARAAPRALQLDVFAPERVSDVAPRLVAADAASREAESGRRRRRTQERVESAAAGLLRSVTERVGEQVSLLRDRRPARSARVERPGGAGHATMSKPSRRRSMLVAGALGAAVLMVGLLWPGDDGGSSADASSEKVDAIAGSVEGAGDDETGAAETSKPAATPSQLPPESPPVSPPEGSAPLGAVPALLDAISACVTAAAATCADAVAEGARTPSDGVAVRGASGSTATLVDDYGDVAVIRLTPIESGADEQMMVLERQNDIWLVRDVYDVAHQPD
ncbi:hypothetical protein [Microbacterium sp. AK031]|uniref:hypothetical protein n=1 Tax=Microbacterium sp. AK031 TaxID=2723076 RepID=UPI0021679C16|nr:hypothetical protein [Microbacterium sp. AK031]MCS3842620.1 hypothetical protein [Microbacterium sp. AK031]